MMKIDEKSTKIFLFITLDMWQSKTRNMSKLTVEILYILFSEK